MWRPFFLSLLVASLLGGPHFAGAAQSMAEPLVLRQDVSVTLHPDTHILTGETTVTYSSAGKVELFLAPSATVERVTVAGKGTPFEFRHGVISVNLSRITHLPIPLKVEFRAYFKDEVAEHPASSEEPTYGVSCAITPRGTFLGSGSRWYPTPASIPQVRSVKIEAPTGTEGITYGRRVSHATKSGMTRSVWEEAHPVGELSLSAGPYLVSARRVGSIDLYAYFYPENAPLAGRYLDAAARYIAFYSELFGPYPFEKFAVVENFFPTGYGLPSYTLLGSSVIRLPFIINTSFPHEIAHSWWGNGIEADYATGNWSEGLVTYLADYLLKEKSSPQEGREYRLQILADYASLVPPEREFPLRRFMARADPASRAIGYGKGAMLFHMIRRTVGDEAFFAALREVVQSRLYGVASWDDFIAAFSHTSGRDLAPFVKQWLDGTGGPRLSLAQVKRQQGERGWTVSGTVQQEGGFYYFQVPVRAESGNGGTPATVKVSGASTPFTVPLPEKPRRLLLDPDAEVFHLLSQRELPPTTNRIKGSDGVIAVMTTGCRTDVRTLRLLLETLDQRSAPIVTEEEADRQKLAASDLLFCGAPSASLMPSLPNEVSLSAAGFTVQGERFAGENDLLFLVRENPLAPGRVAGIFLPLSQGGAEAALPKITHYGKYGYLVFSGGQNRLKGSFLPPPGPSVVEFR